MERKIGEIFEYDGEWYQCVEQCVEHEGCHGCAFDISYGIRCSFNGVPHCSAYRSDGKPVIFKKLEKVGEPFSDECFGLVQKYELKMYCYSTKDKRVCFVDSYDVFIKTKQNKENMGNNADIRPYNELFSPGTVSNTKHLAKEDMEEKEPTYEELLHYYHSTVGLWAINRSPQEVNLDWICKNAFQLGMDNTLPNCERIEKNLKPFNLEAARSGKPVCTRDGRKARIICFDSNGGRPIVALVTECDDEEEMPYKYHCDGYYNCQSIPSDNDLMMLPEKKEGWAKVRKDINLYDTKEEADRKMIGNDEYVTAKVCWEE